MCNYQPHDTTLTLLPLATSTQQERRIGELETQLAESQQQLEATRSLRAVSQEALDQTRGIYKRRMEATAREVADLAKQVAFADPSSPLRVAPEELLVRLQKYIDEVLLVRRGVGLILTTRTRKMVIANVWRQLKQYEVLAR